MSEQSPLDGPTPTELLFDLCWEVYINGRWVKGGRYYAWRRQIARRVLTLLCTGVVGFELACVVDQAHKLLR